MVTPRAPTVRLHFQDEWATAAVLTSPRETKIGRVAALTPSGEEEELEELEEIMLRPEEEEGQNEKRRGWARPSLRMSFCLLYIFFCFFSLSHLFGRN